MARGRSRADQGSSTKAQKERKSKLFVKKFDSKAVKFCDLKPQRFDQKLILKTSKSQSAMEYLMTYGWAILIIAIVMVAMFSLGVFNPLNFEPKAQPGACEVYRSVEGVNLVGQCQGELPQFVAVFNGQSSYVNMGNPTSITQPVALSRYSHGSKQHHHRAESQ